MSPFDNFINAFAAARRLLVQAHKTGSLIEGIVLYVSMIDGLLRIALVLDKQLTDSSPGDLNDYIQQVPGGTKFSERAIYNEAHGRSIIDDTQLAEIVDLYEHRNAVIHRFFLTALTYADLGPLLDRYEVLYDQCAEIVRRLEIRQVEEGRGMTKTGPAVDPQDVFDAMNTKLGFVANDLTP